MMNHIDYKLFTTIAKLKQPALLKSMKTFLKKYYPSENIVSTSDYILCKGTIPVMLVAHLDTVFKHPPKNIYYDRDQKVMWSPQGLGADDRAGVFLIMKIIQNGLRPHICFTTDEESGGIGAKILTAQYKQAPFDMKYIIQLDRQGMCDCVFYSCDNAKFQDYVEKFNFTTEWGTFSDISILCPTWKVAGVNLSVGYINEHSKQETLHTYFLYATLDKVQKMLKDSENASCFKYVPMPQERYWEQLYDGCYYPMEYDYGFDYDDFGPVCQCSSCKQYFNEDDVFLVMNKDGTKSFYCIDCVAKNVNWCSNCGEPFEITYPEDDRCYSCREKEKKINEV